MELQRTDDSNTILEVENTNAAGTSAASVVRTLANGGITTNVISHASQRTLVRFGETLGSWSEIHHNGGNGLVIGTLNNTSLILGTNGANRLEIDGTGNVVHFSAGTVHPDFVFDEDYNLESIESHAKTMWDKKHLPAVGPGEYAEDGRAVFRLADDQVGILEELEKAHVYIEQLHNRLSTKESEFAKMQDRLARLEVLLTKKQ